MNVITLDIPLLFIGIIILLWYRFKKKEIEFQLLCQLISTFQAQYSFGVAWSLGRLTPILSATSFAPKTKTGLISYMPFVYYVFISSVISSYFWHIPEGVSFFYGEGRLLVQLFNFSCLALSTNALTNVLINPEAVVLFWRWFRVTAIFHGLASLYQLIATNIGLPLIGISRAHGLTQDANLGDVAAFASDKGFDILRPGGLAGEPKTVAVIFGILIMCTISIGYSLDKSLRDRCLTIAAFLLSAIGFLAAFSTSAFAGICFLTVIIIAISKGSERIKIIKVILLLALCSLLYWLFFTNDSLESLFSLITQRTTGRFNEEIDPPIEAAINALINNAYISIFGTGLGGSTFLVMEYLNETYEYSYAPSIGIVLILVESGIIGTFLFIGVFIILSYKAFASCERSQESKLLLIMGVSAMTLCLSGSGIYLGYPLAIACVTASIKLSNSSI